MSNVEYVDYPEVSLGRLRNSSDINYMFIKFDNIEYCILGSSEFSKFKDKFGIVEYVPPEKKIIPPTTNVTHTISNRVSDQEIERRKKAYELRRQRNKNYNNRTKINNNIINNNNYRTKTIINRTKINNNNNKNLINIIKT